MRNRRPNGILFMIIFFSMVNPLIVFTSGCKSRNPEILSGPYYGGLLSLNWGSRVSTMDSVLQSDTSMTLISRIPNLKTKGQTIVVRHQRQDYYLDYNSRHELASFNYFSENDSNHSLDSLMFHLAAHYGQPELHVQPAYSRHTWKVPHNGGELSLQLIKTGQRYSMTVVHHQFSE